MEIHQLRYFVALAEEGNFTRAAARVRVAQPSLSQQIRKLEEELGCRLVARLNRRAVLTEAGREFLPCARNILQELRRARQSVEAISGPPQGRVSIGILPTIAPFIIGQLYETIRAAHPRVELRVIEQVTHNLIQALEEGELDLALLSTCDSSGTLEKEPVGKERLHLVTHPGHPLWETASPNWQRLADEPFLMLHETNCLARQIRSWLTSVEVPPVRVFPTLQLETTLAIIRTGTGASLVPTMALPPKNDTRLRVESHLPESPEREINFLRNPAMRRTAAADAVAACVREVIRTIQAAG